jgi:NADH-quinone oxidoreductase subunit N
MSAIILTAIWGVVMMFSGIFMKKNAHIRLMAIAGLVLVLVANLLDMRDIHLIRVNTHEMLEFTTFGYVFNMVSFGCTLLYFLLSGSEMEKVGTRLPEYFALIFFVLCGIGIVSSFQTLLMLFLGIEIISIPLYILTGSDKRNLKSNEASLKYFLMGAFSTGLMLMGIALMYGARKTFAISGLGFGTGVMTGLTAGGLILLLVSMSFKVSAAPFHFWTPDVYDGAPTVFTAFMATIVKAAGFVAFIRLFEGSFGAILPQWSMMVAVIIAATLLIGNLTAVFQQSVKRMLAYSSIAQAGFMMFGVLALTNTTAREGILLYAAAYSLATIGIFAVLLKMKDYTYDGFNGLAKHQPLLAATTTIFLLSLAGIPLTAGFFSKFLMLQSVVRNGGYLWLVILAVLCAAVSVYYYFRVIQAMYFKEGPDPVVAIPASFKYLLVLVAALVVLLGLYPQILLSWLYF